MTPPVRVWRVRKNSTWLDARIDAGGDANGVELQFFRDNTLISTRRWPSREEALADAARQLGELQLAGWNTHW
jgi:hypothetical protein